MGRFAFHKHVGEGGFEIQRWMTPWFPKTSPISPSALSFSLYPSSRMSLSSLLNSRRHVSKSEADCMPMPSPPLNPAVTSTGSETQGIDIFVMSILLDFSSPWSMWLFYSLFIGLIGLFKFLLPTKKCVAWLLEQAMYEELQALEYNHTPKMWFLDHLVLLWLVANGFIAWSLRLIDIWIITKPILLH